MPAARVGFAATVEAPCSGCNWICNLKASHCIKQVPPEVAIAEARQVLDQKSPFHTRIIKPDPELLSQWTSEAAATYRSRVRATNQRAYELELSNRALTEGAAQHEANLPSATAATEERPGGDALDARSRESAALLGQIKELTRLVGQQGKSLLDKQLELVEVQEDRERLQKLLTHFQTLLREWRQEYEAMEEKADNLQADVEGLRDQLKEITQAHEDAQSLLESVRRSVFSKLFVKLGVWKDFR